MRVPAPAKNEESTAMALHRVIHAALPAVVLGMGLSLGTAAAEVPPPTISTLGDPPHAALLNAATVLSGLAPDRSIGLGIQTLGSAAAGVEVAGIEVSGVTVSAEGAPGVAHTVSTMGEPSHAALLNTATALSGLGPTGAMGRCVIAYAG
jgi:hypothetical protein